MLPLAERSQSILKTLVDVAMPRLGEISVSLDIFFGKNRLVVARHLYVDLETTVDRLREATAVA